MYPSQSMLYEVCQRDPLWSQKLHKRLPSPSYEQAILWVYLSVQWNLFELLSSSSSFHSLPLPIALSRHPGGNSQRESSIQIPLPHFDPSSHKRRHTLYNTWHQHWASNLQIPWIHEHLARTTWRYSNHETCPIWKSKEWHIQITYKVHGCASTQKNAWCWCI